jgi:heptosyltransferase-2
MVMAQSLFIALRHQYTHCQIDVLAPHWTKELLAHMPQVNKIIDMPLGHGVLDLKTRYQLGKQLRTENYDQAIVLPNSFKSALIPFFARIPQRTGWRGEMRYGLLNDIRILNKEHYPRMVERFVALAFKPNENFTVASPQLSVSTQGSENALAKYHLHKEQPILVLCPGAEFGPAKRWPAEYYTHVAKQKINEGWQVWLMGSKNDQTITATIYHGVPTEQQCAIHDLAGQTSIAEAIDLLSLASAVVTNDSGLLHIACALNRKVVAIYGSTSPTFTPPLGKAKIERLNIECSPCFERTCPLGHLKCLRELTPHNVLASLTQLVGQ